MEISRRSLLCTSAAMAVGPIVRARAQGGSAAKHKIKLGVLTDLSGTYRDNTGPTSVAAAMLAVEEFAGSGSGFDVEIINADHQNKPDVAASISRQWFDQGVDAVIDVPTSSVALAVAQVAREKDKIMLNASATVSSLTDQQCSPNTIVWSFDTFSNATSTGGQGMKVLGKKWFFITANYAFGHSLEELTAQVIKAGGGQVMGAVRYPFPDTTDFSAFIQQGMASGADVLASANAELDCINVIKQAKEFGADKTMRIAPLLMFLQDAHGLGLETAQGLYTTESFYWDLNDRTRAFTKRVLAKSPNNYPNQAHASSYAITRHYLKTAVAMGPEITASGRAAVARMKSMPTDDDAFGKGSIRDDGRGAFPAYLFQVKAPAESKSPWDLYKLIATTPPDRALHPLNPNCRFQTA